MKEYDLIIVGAAPAGLTAAIFATRRALKTLVLSKDLGGQAATTPLIENYPGFLKVDGMKLMQKFEKQALKFRAEIIYEEVLKIEKEEEKFVCKTGNGGYKSKAVILAYGKTPKSLNVPGENKYQGKGISYCANCDMPLFRDKTIAVVGGGNSALDAAIYGSEITKKVYLIHRRDQFRGFESAVQHAKKKHNIEFVLNSIVTEAKGDNFLRSIAVENVQTNEKREIEVDGVFVEIGSEVNVNLIKDLVKLDENNHVVVNHNQETSYPNSDKIHPGLFAAGDLTQTPFKQIVISAGEGCKAALQAYNYIKGPNAYPFVADWATKPKLK